MNAIERFLNEYKCITQRNSILLNYPEHKVQQNRVNLHYYHADWQDNVLCNLGDYLSEVIVLWMCKEKGIQFDKEIEETRNLYAIGSILQMGYQDATIWGSGFAFEMNGVRAYLHKYRKLVY